jgi:hypothetical protein
MSPTSSPVPSLVAALAGDAAKERRVLARRYAQLLAASMPAPGDDPAAVPPDPKRLAQLKQLADALGKSPADVEADAGVVQQVRHHRATIARAAGSAAARAAAQQAFTAYDAESVRIRDERVREYRRLYAVFSALGFTWRAAADSVGELNRLLDKHPELLGHEPRASERECE